MAGMIKPFKCNLHKNVLSAEFCGQHKDLFPAAYFDAAPMAGLSIELARRLDSSLAMLPFDYVSEAEAYGAELIGFDDDFGLRAKGKHLNAVNELTALPPMDFTRGRLAEIIKAVGLIKDAGYVPCLNITGYFALIDILLPIEKGFSAWRKRQPALLEFFAIYERDLLEYITLALNAGAQVISYSDPLTSLELLGIKNGQQIAAELILPFFKKISCLENNGVIHVCGISSDILTAADAAWQEIKLEQEEYYSTAVVRQALQATEIKFLGRGCLHHKRKTNTIMQLLIEDIKE
jgi:uroporphyrinogen-III decarboxylase